MRGRLAVSVAIGAVAACLIAPAAASADFHLIQIREVYPGSTTTNLNADYIVLQMYAGGQEFVKDREVHVYDAGGTVVDTNFAGNVAAGANQSTILLGSAEVQAQFGVAPDMLLNGALDPAGGAVCWANLDCASWGNFSKPELLKSAGGTPAGAIPDGLALQRTIARGCATALDPADDQDNSAADFSAAAPAPRPNSLPPTEKPCSGGGGGSGGAGGGGGDPSTHPDKAPQTQLRGRPAKRTTDRTPTFRFSSDDKAAKYQCKVDGKPFRGCRSPFTTQQLSFGPHTFKVRAIGHHGDRDNSPAAYSFKVVRAPKPPGSLKD